MPKPYIIAEIGSNHRGKLELALEQIKAAAECGCSAAKFQLFTHEELYGYKGDNTYALPREWVRPLSSHCNSFNIDFLCSIFSLDGLDFIEHEANPKVHKIASSEAVDKKLVAAATKTGKIVLVSNAALNSFEDQMLPYHVIFLECSAKYPAHITDYALTKIDQGISDHTLDHTLAIAAAARGAYIFEKHFDCMKDITEMDSPDACVSIGMKAMKEYVKVINDVKTAYSNLSTISDERLKSNWMRRETEHGFFRKK